MFAILAVRLRVIIGKCELFSLLKCVGEFAFGDKKTPVAAGAVVGVMVLGGGWLKFGVGLDEGGIIGF